MTFEEAKKVTKALNQCDDSHYHSAICDCLNEHFTDFLWEPGDYAGGYEITVKERA